MGEFPRMICEDIWCCYCNGRGKIPRLVFWKRDCPVCDGKGERVIMMCADFPPEIKQQVRDEARYGFNRFRAVGPFESVANQIASKFF